MPFRWEAARCASVGVLRDSLANSLAISDGVITATRVGVIPLGVQTEEGYYVLFWWAAISRYLGGCLPA